MNVAIKDIVILAFLLPLLFLIFFQYYNQELFQYEIISDYNGITETQPPIATENPYIYLIYRYQWIFVVFVLIFALFYTDWKNVKKKIDKIDNA